MHEQQRAWAVRLLLLRSHPAAPASRWRKGERMSLYKQLIQIGMPENDGKGSSLTDDQQAQWLYDFTVRAKSWRTRAEYAEANSIPRQTVADALDALRAEWAGTLNLAPQSAEEDGYNANIQGYLADLDATIAKLGLDAKEKSE